MCNFKSGLIFKNRVVLAPEGNESHSDLLESMNIEDTRLNASKMFVRAELTPPDGNKAADIEKWKFRVDQDIVPDWYADDPKRYNQEYRNAVSDWLKDRFMVMCGHAWVPIKTDEKGTYYLMDCKFDDMEFGETNNYAESNIRKTLNDSNLATELKKEFGDRLVPITTDLLSLDGLDDYGKVEGDILAIPTIDLYRECRKKITNLYSWWWLATPNSTLSCYSSDYVRCVRSDGRVSCDWCVCVLAVRPFFILKS